MKNSFSVFEIILTLIISSIVIIYSSVFMKDIYFENENSQKIELEKLDLLSTKIFLQKHRNNLDELKFENKSLYYQGFLLLKNVNEFNLNISNNQIIIKININDKIKQIWIF